MPALLTAAQLAAELQVKPTTVRKWHRTGKIPCRRISGRVVRYDLEEVLAALKALGAKKAE